MKRLFAAKVKVRVIFSLLALCTVAALSLPAGAYAADYDPDLYHGPTEADKLYIQQLIQERSMRPKGMEILAAPTGTVWTPGEYEALYGPIVCWKGYASELTDFVVGVTTDPNMDSVAFVAVPSSSQSSAYSTLQSGGADMDRVKFMVYDTGTGGVWVRDFGPRYIYEDGDPAIIDFTYNRNRPSADAFPAWIRTNDIPFLQDEPLYEMDLTHGGGNFHCVSDGNAFMSTLILDENTDKNQSEIETIIEDHHNVNVTIWDRLPDEIERITGHIDMWLLPLSDNKILVSDFPEEEDYSAANAIVDGATADLEAMGYTVYRTLSWNTSPGSASSGTYYTYTNAAIINKRVFIPYYGGAYTDEDADALAVFKAALPDHTIIPWNASSISSAGGAIH